MGEGLLRTGAQAEKPMRVACCPCRSSIDRLDNGFLLRERLGSMIPLLQFFDYVIDLYVWVIIFSVILSWLLAFGVINSHNPFVRSLYQALSAVTEPLLQRIRALLPDLGAIDISPVVLLLGCMFVQNVVIRGWLIPLFAGA